MSHPLPPLELSQRGRHVLTVALKNAKPHWAIKAEQRERLPKALENAVLPDLRSPDAFCLVVALTQQPRPARMPERILVSRLITGLERYLQNKLAPSTGGAVKLWEDQMAEVEVSYLESNQPLPIPPAEENRQADVSVWQEPLIAFEKHYFPAVIVMSEDTNWTAQNVRIPLVLMPAERVHIVPLLIALVHSLPGLERAEIVI